MQKQNNSKGQFGRPPFNVRFASTSYAATALYCRMIDRIGLRHHSLKGSCCCAGPVRDAHGRKFTTFPYWVQGKKFFGQTRSPKTKKKPPNWRLRGQYPDQVLRSINKPKLNIVKR